jgi:hypothetical protein
MDDDLSPGTLPARKRLRHLARLRRLKTPRRMGPLLTGWLIFIFRWHWKCRGDDVIDLRRGVGSHAVCRAGDQGEAVANVNVIRTEPEGCLDTEVLEYLRDAKNHFDVLADIPSG